MLGSARLAVLCAAAAVATALPVHGAARLRRLRHARQPSFIARSSSVSSAGVGTRSLDWARGNHKTEYYGTVQVGDPAQEFSVIFDTGSGNLILPGPKCSSEACQQHKIYDNSKSNGAFQVGISGETLGVNPGEKSDVTIKFGTGEVHGELYQDQVCLAENYVCAKTHFISADSETTEPFLNMRFDGILGMGFKSLSVGEGFNIVDDMVDQRAMPADQFSIYLDDDDGSEISFGGYKPALAATPLHWVPVSKQGYWQIMIDDVAVNNQASNLCPNCQVAVDTGTSMLAGPSKVVKAISEQLGVAQDCSNFKQLPYLGFAVNGAVLNLQPKDYIDRGIGGCTLSIMPLDMGPDPIFVFGDPFLRRFLTVYDRSGPRVGFAVARGFDVDDATAAALLYSYNGGNATNTSAPVMVENSGQVWTTELGAELIQEGHRGLITAKLRRAPRARP